MLMWPRSVLILRASWFALGNRLVATVERELFEEFLSFQVIHGEANKASLDLKLKLSPQLLKSKYS